jgi:apolipoprotein N-acyltransferase
MVIARRSALNCFASFGIGGLVSTGYPFGIAAAIFTPAFSMRQASRLGAYAAAFCYYTGASWPVIPAARNFFGPSASIVEEAGAWLAAAVLLAVPWAFAWTRNQDQLIWRVPLAPAASVVPPLGIIGWASPLTAAGLLFPGTAWAGLLAVAIACSLMAIDRSRCYAVLAIAMLAVLSYVGKGANPQPPLGWEAVNTSFGTIAHGQADPIHQYEVAQWIEDWAESSNARVLVFPEMAVPRWTAATELFWQPTLTKLASTGKTLLIGAGIADPSRLHRGEIVHYDFASAVAVLRAEPTTVSQFGKGEQGKSARYRNALLMLGAQRGKYIQHIPVPLGMWHPFGEGGVPLDLFGPGVISIADQRAVVLICYEQLLTWPVLLSMSQRATVLIAIANDYWVKQTPIPRYQTMATRAWTRLFGVPLLAAVNR